MTPQQPAYERSGRGEPLLLLHPLGADRRVWEPIVERLRDERELIAVDLPGFGQSPPLRGREPSPAALAEAIAELSDALGLERPHVAGNSLGGWVALELALLGAVRTVTAIAPAGLWPAPLVPKPAFVHQLASVLAPGLRALAATRSGRRLMLSGIAAHPERVPPRAASHLVWAWARAPGFVAVNAAMRSRVFSGLDRITVPVTLIWPERDRLVARPRLLPSNVRSVTLPDAGHVPMWDGPDKVAAILLGAGSGHVYPAGAGVVA